MKKCLILAFIVLLTSCASTDVLDKVPELKNLEIPYTPNPGDIVCHTGYCLLYNEKYELAEWVAYQLTKEETNKVVDRKDRFHEDPAIKTGSATLKDYEGSGYDRGHLAPVADFKWSA